MGNIKKRLLGKYSCGGHETIGSYIPAINKEAVKYIEELEAKVKKLEDIEERIQQLRSLEDSYDSSDFVLSEILLELNILCGN